MSFETADFEFAAGRVDQLPPSFLPEVVFSGRSNVGKSSIINKLLSRKSLARVSSTPGKTVTINFYNLGFCRLVDLPGYGYAKASHAEKMRWSGLVEGYFNAGRDIKAVIQLTDIRRLPTEDDCQMIRYIQAKGIPCVIAATKSDKLNKTQRTAQLEAYGKKFGGDEKTDFIPVSAFNSEGIAQMKNIILDICKK